MREAAHARDYITGPPAMASENRSYGSGRTLDLHRSTAAGYYLASVTEM